MKEGYIVLKNLVVRGANPAATPLLVGTYTPSSIIGFATGLTRQLEDETKLLDVAIIHHRAESSLEKLGLGTYAAIKKGTTLFDKDDYNTKLRKKPVLSLQPQMTMTFEISLVIAVEADRLPDRRAIQILLREGRICGGNIDSYNKDILITSDYEEVREHAPKSGFSLIDRTEELLEPVDKSADSRIDGFISLIAMAHKTEEEAKSDQKESGDVEAEPLPEKAAKPEKKLYLVPNVLGFQIISEKTQRLGAREDLPHAYAEPMLGIVEFKNIKDAGLVFWHQKNISPKTILFTTNEVLNDEK